MNPILKNLHILIFLIGIIILRVFVFEIYLIPTGSMENTVLPGDIVLVNKLNKHIERNDIVVFHYPCGDTIYINNPNIVWDMMVAKFGYQKALADTAKHGTLKYTKLKHRQPYIKRCVAIPGDELIVSNDTLVVNGQSMHFENEILGRKFTPNKPKTKNKKKTEISTEISQDFFRMFPYSRKSLQKRGIRNYGPVYVNGKSDTIRLTSRNFPFYKRIIQNYEGNTVELLDSFVNINGETVTQYIPKQDYYFMIGDNRYNSIDSRFWGFVPQDHIIGKAEVVLFSWNRKAQGVNKVRWNRVLKVIN